MNPWAGYRMGPSATPKYPKPRGCKSATTDLSTSCVVVERSDHRCGDDLVSDLLADKSSAHHRI